MTGIHSSDNVIPGDCAKYAGRDCALQLCRQLLRVLCVPRCCRLKLRNLLLKQERVSRLCISAPLSEHWCGSRDDRADEQQDCFQGRDVPQPPMLLGQHKWSASRLQPFRAARRN